jgi:hypothetical protein
MLETHTHTQRISLHEIKTKNKRVNVPTLCRANIDRASVLRAPTARDRAALRRQRQTMKTKRTTTTRSEQQSNRRPQTQTKPRQPRPRPRASRPARASRPRPARRRPYRPRRHPHHHRHHHPRPDCPLRPRALPRPRAARDAARTWPRSEQCRGRSRPARRPCCENTHQQTDGNHMGRQKEKNHEICWSRIQLKSRGCLT